MRISLAVAAGWLAAASLWVGIAGCEPGPTAHGPLVAGPDDQLPVAAAPECPAAAIPPMADCRDGWCRVPAGCFTMGGDSTTACRTSTELPRLVQVTGSLRIAATETTQGAFEAAMGYNPSADLDCGPDCPVESVSWHEAAAYCNALSAAEGLAGCYQCVGAATELICQPAGQDPRLMLDCAGYRLPTEAEWEHAARAGQRTSYTGGEPSECHATDVLADAVAWYAGNADGHLHPVAGKLANGWGLHDTSGNAAEWTNDGFGELGSTPAVDPTGTAFSISQVVRGGSFDSRPGQVRVTSRQQQASEARSDQIGFRCLRMEAVQR